MNGDVLLALVPVTIAAIILWRGMRPVGDAELQTFVDRFFVSVDPSEAPFVRARLRRSRVVRLGAVAIGVLVAGLPTYVNLIDNTRSSDFANPLVSHAWIAAAAIAALFVELMVVQRPVLVRRAVVETRQTHHYVSSRWTRRLAVGGSVAITLSIVGLASGSDHRLDLLVGVTGGTIALGATWAGLRQVTDRPRLAPDGPLRDVDDGLRCYGAHHLVGAATALAMTASSTALLAFDLRGWPAAPFLLLALILPYYGLSVWWRLARQERWPISAAKVAAR